MTVPHTKSLHNPTRQSRPTLLSRHHFHPYGVARTRPPHAHRARNKPETDESTPIRMKRRNRDVEAPCMEDSARNFAQPSAGHRTSARRNHSLPFRAESFRLHEWNCGVLPSRRVLLRERETVAVFFQPRPVKPVGEISGERDDELIPFRRKAAQDGAY